MPTAELSVAVYDNDGSVFKHWTLFYDGPSDEEKFIFNIMGSSTRYRYEKRQSDARASATLLELVTICRVDVSKLSIIEDLAQTAEIHNEAPGYNCQDYVLELLDALENNDVINGQDKKYRKSRAILEAKVDGLA
nr:hypothetical protein CFP56_73142 [Quercus suber]